ncbi:TonB-dependent receptor plug domain-containing protein [Inhella proteolytica]|uniref:TonB-dependent receptor n=1 Tax=Inhella proteolytica TaxID=2795029 RepID=A0A931J0R2_9BURK|nr:TonB-dependent receptor [Inhella proteolytica]MBH9577374.1 TonB-dependent receptor [Inhella proteolytica]
MKPCPTPRRHALAAAALALSAQCAFAQSDSADASKLERVVVTGSSIKRLAAETASPVQIVSRQEIKQTGANTVRQVLDTITATTTGELRDDGAAASFASGASGVSMRGLGKGATLVLVNGRRVANFGLADGAKETFVNIDAIPADAIDRLEILKDGASALYGSDAMAGVINIITRSEFRGIGGQASYQSGIDPNIGKQTTASIVAGIGDLAKDRFNVFANVEYYKRERYFLTDVMGYYPEWHKRIVSPAFGDPSLVSYPGNFFNGSTRVANPACPSTQRNSAGACTTDINGINQFSDGAERLNSFMMARVMLGENLEFFGDASYSKTRVDYLAIPFGINAPATPFRWFDGNAKVVRQVNKPMLPVGHPLNTFTRPIGLEYRFMDPGLSWEAPAEATQYRVLAGLKGTFGEWDWEVSAGRVGSDAVKESLAPHAATFIKAIESNEYKIGGQNSPELLQRMFHSAAINGDNYQNHIDAKMTGELMRLPAGPLQAAFGIEHRAEHVYIKSVDEVMRAELIGRGALWVEGKRDLDAAYAEFEGPLVKNLTANAAVRFDKATGFDGRFSPKAGLRWVVSPQLLVRGTASGGFRAPNIPETLGKIGVTGFFNSTYDPKRCDTATQIRDILRTGDANDRAEATAAYNSGCLASVPAMISANKNLEPELSRSYTLGFVFEPTADTSLAFDYFKIERRNEISSRDPSYVLDREGKAGYENLIARAPISAQDKIWSDRANALKPGSNIAWGAGSLITLLLQYENFGKTETSGIDFDISTRFTGDLGTLRLGLSTTYALSYRAWDIDEGKYRPNTVGLRGVPRIKSVVSGAWTTGPWTYGVRFNYTSSTQLNFDETDVGTWAPSACETRLKPGDLPCYLGSDITTQLSLAYTGFKGLTLRASMGNAFGEERPVDLRGGYGVRPRTVKIGFEYKY